MFETLAGFGSMADAIEQTGNHAVVLGESARRYLSPISEQPKGIEVLPDHQSIETADIDAILFEGDADRLLRVLQAVRLRPGAMVPVMSLRTEQIKAGESWPTYRLVQEKSICINTAAAGGNASLMMLA
jgi:RHH-type proline utilization regulon transcriptional repressor/proline dehydrogenase/delta 1-pyrroline-5-carboxylate dehydrogenase